VLRPPRERPSPSRPAFLPPGFLSFADAPRGQVSGGDPAGASGVLVRADHSGVRADRPLLPFTLITAGPQRIQDLFPGAIARPAAMPLIDGQPVPVIRRQIPPRAAGPGTEQDPVDRPPVICPPATPARVRRHQRRQPLPLPILKIMPGNHINVIYTPGPSRSRKHALGPRHC
jgi:hypothetical protein